MCARRTFVELRAVHGRRMDGLSICTPPLHFPSLLNPNTRTKALRLHEAVRKAEIEVAGKYVELVEQLREESAQELGRQVSVCSAAGGVWACM